MKKILFLSVCAAGLLSCGGNKTNENEKAPVADSTKTAVNTTQTATVKTEEFIPNGKKGIEGFLKQLYCGEFKATQFDENKAPAYANRITICIDSVNGTLISGFSVVAGNKRPFSGKMKETLPDEFYCEVSEPGNDKYDGTFRFTIKPAAKKLAGNWFANDKKLAVTERSFDLNNATFKYDASLEMPKEIENAELYVKEFQGSSDYERVSEKAAALNASTTVLTKTDVENLYKGDLEIIRNAVYARHGYSFKSRRMRFIFDQYVNWYVPLYIDVRNQLTKIESDNIQLLKRYEEHAENYYDTYGR